MEQKPIYLTLTDGQIARLTVEQTKALFTLAEAEGKIDQFNEHYWSAVNRIRCNQELFDLQDALSLLEEYKRFCGRKFNECRLQGDRAFTGTLAAYYCGRYNRLELCIDKMCKTFGLTRGSKPYFIDYGPTAVQKYHI